MLVEEIDDYEFDGSEFKFKQTKNNGTELASVKFALKEIK